MIAIVSLLLVIFFSILVTRIATIALTHTGLAKESARFQARSALTGAGFTTSESEKVVGHPVRRRVVLMLMLIGNAGIVTAVSSLMLGFVGQGASTSVTLRIVALAVGLAALWSLAMSPWVDRHLSHIIDRALRRYTNLDVKDYASLMHLAGEYRLVEVHVEESDWLAGRTLGEAALREEGIVVLGVERPDGTYLGAPDGSTGVCAGDNLLVYGRVSAIEEIDLRRRDRRGDLEHAEAVREQREVAELEKRADPAASRS